jgi:hypothetical protein
MLRKICPTEACSETQGLVSFQSNLDSLSLSVSTLIVHGSCKEGSWVIESSASVHKLLHQVEDFGMASLRKMVHKTSASGRLARPSIPSLNE